MFILPPPYNPSTFTASPWPSLTSGTSASVAALEDLPPPFEKVSVKKLTFLFHWKCEGPSHAFPWAWPRRSSPVSCPAPVPSIHSGPQHTESWREAKFVSSSRGPAMYCTSVSGVEEWHRRIISRVSGTQIVEIRNKGPDSEHLLGTSFVDLALSKNPGAQHEQGGSEVKTGPVQSMGRVSCVTAPEGNPQIPNTS